MLPGWESLAVTSAYARWFTYAGWAALFLLGIFEIISHTYSVHESTLKETVAARRADDLRAEYDARIAEATERTEQLRKDNLLLEAEIARVRVRTEYRHLTPAQQKSLGDKMKEFSGTVFSLVVYQSENDAQELSSDIRGALDGPDSAGWHLGSSGGIGSGAPETGVVIKFKPTAEVAAHKLANALREAGLYAPPPSRIAEDILDVNLRMMISKETQIVIVIGKRP